MFSTYRLGKYLGYDLGDDLSPSTIKYLDGHTMSIIVVFGYRLKSHGKLNCTPMSVSCSKTKFSTISTFTRNEDLHPEGEIGKLWGGTWASNTEYHGISCLGKAT